MTTVTNTLKIEIHHVIPREFFNATKQRDIAVRGVMRSTAEMGQIAPSTMTPPPD